jgi:uncharacterized membrane protein
MGLSDLFSNLQVFVRWLHEFVGMLWIGNIFFFDFVIVPLQRSAGDPEESVVHPTLLRRGLFWIRWPGLMSMALGVILLGLTYFYIPGQGLGPNKMLLDGRFISSRAIWIFLGMLIAAVMFFNIWFIMEPAQKRLLQGKVAREDVIFLRRRAFRSLRAATFLSGPMLFAMLAPSHYGAVSFTILVIAVAAGCLVVWCAIKISSVV